MLGSAQFAGFRTLLRTMGYGAFLRGVESVLEQELQYVGDEEATAACKSRKRAPRVALATAAAVIGLLVVIEDPWAAGVAAALHLGFHGSGWMWKKLGSCVSSK